MPMATDSAYTELFSSRWRPVEASFLSKYSTTSPDISETTIYALHSWPSRQSSDWSKGWHPYPCVTFKDVYERLISSFLQKVIVLLHGYPQNLTLWYSLIQEIESKYPEILDEYHILIPDLPGYGQSKKMPSNDGTHLANSKRAVAADIVDFVDQVLPGTSRFLVVGHDRGARVAYRLAKDYRERVVGLCVIDIVPTIYPWKAMSYENNRHANTISGHHWIILATEAPVPETLIGASYQFYITYNIESWTGERWKGKHNPIAMRSWVEQYRDPTVLKGALEDYRAGATIDLDHDEEDEKAGKAGVDCALLVLAGLGEWNHFDVDGIWNKVGKEGKTKLVKIGDEDVGHFLMIEEAEQTTRELVNWLKGIVWWIA